AGLLARLGRRKEARELFDQLASEPDAQEVLQSVMAAEYSAGFKDEAFARAASLLAKAQADDHSAVVLLFQSSPLEANVESWWKFLRKKFPQDNTAATLKRLRDLSDHKMPARDEAALLKEMADEAASLKDDERGPWLAGVVDNCRGLNRE